MERDRKKWRKYFRDFQSNIDFLNYLLEEKKDKLDVMMGENAELENESNILEVLVSDSHKEKTYVRSGWCRANSILGTGT